MHRRDYHLIKLGIYKHSFKEQLSALVNGILEAIQLNRTKIVISTFMADLEGEEFIPISKLINLEEWENRLNKILNKSIELYDVTQFKIEIIKVLYEDVDVTDKICTEGKIKLKAGYNLNNLIGYDPKPKVPKKLYITYKLDDDIQMCEVPEYDGLLRDIDYWMIPIWCQQGTFRSFYPDFYDVKKFYTILKSIPYKIELNTTFNLDLITQSLIIDNKPFSITELITGKKSLPSEEISLPKEKINSEYVNLCLWALVFKAKSILIKTDYLAKDWLEVYKLRIKVLD